jgi:protein-disulfide isomerase
MIRLWTPARRTLGALTLLLAVLALPLAGPAFAQQSTPGERDSPFTAAEREAINQMIRDYILENPEVIPEAVNILQQRRQQQAQQEAERALEDNRQALTDSGLLPVAGNPDGDVTVIEFFDYRCPYCRRVAGVALDAVKADGNAKLIYKEFPILGPDSEDAAHAAVAAALQGKYLEFHKGLMTDVQKVNRDSALRLAKSLDLDVEQLKADMTSDEVQRVVQDTLELGRRLQIRGTPAFIVGDQVAPGAISKDQLTQMIQQARKSDG